MPFLSPSQQGQSTEGMPVKEKVIQFYANASTKQKCGDKTV